MDFFTFIAIAVFLYAAFSKKDKKPQRGQRPPEDTGPVSRPEPRRKENLFEQIERQLRESAEKLEQELQGKTAAPPPRRTVTVERPKSSRAAMERYSQADRRSAEELAGSEGTWGTEGRSDYDNYRSVQGNDSRGVEGYDSLSSQGYDSSFAGEGRQMTTGSAAPASVRPAEAAQERMAGIFANVASPLAQGIIWSEILKEPKGRRALSRRGR